MKFNNNEELSKYFKTAIEKESSLEIETLRTEIEGMKSEARQKFKKRT